jgi:hypothetical protein
LGINTISVNTNPEQWVAAGAGLGVQLAALDAYYHEHFEVL